LQQQLKLDGEEQNNLPRFSHWFTARILAYYQTKSQDNDNNLIAGLFVTVRAGTAYLEIKMTKVETLIKNVWYPCKNCKNWL